MTGVGKLSIVEPSYLNKMGRESAINRELNGNTNPG
jgi:hypothetical protein